MRLIIVSNRLPFTVSFKEATPGFEVSSGGLTTGRMRRRPLRGVYHNRRKEPNGHVHTPP